MLRKIHCAFTSIHSADDITGNNSSAKHHRRRRSTARRCSRLDGTKRTSGSQRSRQRDKLLLHLTLDVDYETGSGLYNMLSMTIVNRFYTTGGSVTAALRDAVKACNEALIANNARPNTIRAEGSLVCAVTRGSELLWHK